MSSRNELISKMVVEGRAVTITILDNLIIDDVIGTEAQIHALSLQGNGVVVKDRRVDRSIRDFLVRTGVER